MCSTSLWDPFSGLILESQIKLELFTMLSIYILALNCNHLEVIVLDVMDRNRNNIFLKNIEKIYMINVQVYIFSTARDFCPVETLLCSFGIKQEMLNAYAIGWQCHFYFYQ